MRVKTNRKSNTAEDWPIVMSFMTECSTTSSKMFSTRMKEEKSSKISSWKRGSSCVHSQNRSTAEANIYLFLSKYSHFRMWLGSKVLFLLLLSHYVVSSSSGTRWHCTTQYINRIASKWQSRLLVKKCFETHWGTGRAQLLQHVRDEDLEESLTEESLPHCAAVIIKFLTTNKRTKRKSINTTVGL